MLPDSPFVEIYRQLSELLERENASEDPVDPDFSAFVQACLSGQFLDTKSGTWVEFAHGKFVGSAEERNVLLESLTEDVFKAGPTVQQVNVPITTVFLRSPKSL